MKERTSNLSLVLRFLGIISIILSCMFTSLAFGEIMRIVREVIERQSLINIFVFMIVSIIGLTIAGMCFIIDAYGCLNQLEREVYGKRENR